MAGVPEFMLRKLFVKDSVKSDENGFSFALNNTFAPATITRFALTVDGKEVPQEDLSIQAGDGEVMSTADLSEDKPFSLPVKVLITLTVSGHALGEGNLGISLHTVEAGPLAFGLQVKEAKSTAPAVEAPRKWKLPKFLRRPFKATVHVDADKVMGQVQPEVYGHFIEHLERCIYDGIWTEDGSALRPDTLRLVQALKPTVIRYPGGNFASGYHWEDGIGPKDQRPVRMDKAWQSEESNQVGTDEFLAYCREVGAQPFLVVNDGSGTPEEAARWVAYCNEDASTEQGARRAANGHPEPYAVHWWGVGNEVWGQWQIGTTDAASYAKRLRAFVEAMRAVDSSIRIVAVGDKVMSGAVADPGAQWNETVLREAGDCFDDISFHLYQPDREGWQDAYDPDELYKTVTAAPLDVERIIQRIGRQIQAHAPDHKIGVAFDEWNLWLAPADDADSMHDIAYSRRDALYAAGMLHVFHRQCKLVTMANLAQMVNVLPLIKTNEKTAFATAMYFPMQMYRQMEETVIETKVKGPVFTSQRLGNIDEVVDAPYIDVTATRDNERQRVVIGVINRHPDKRVDLAVRLNGTGDLKPRRGWLLSSKELDAVNSFEKPDALKVKEVELPQIRTKDHFRLDLPPCSVSILELK
jgi:alpha-L-arabinofuranosidase